MAFSSSDPIAALLATLRSVQDVPPTGSVGSMSAQTLAASTAGPSSSAYVSESLAEELEEYDPREPSSFRRTTNAVASSSGHSSSFSQRSSTKALSFPQALGIISTLAEDPDFLAKLSKLRRDQDDLETRLSREREALIAEHRSKVDVALKTSEITGVGISPFERQNYEYKLTTALSTFHSTRVLAAWDSLARRQAIALEALGVPNMSEGQHGDKAMRKRIIRALEGILGEDG